MCSFSKNSDAAVSRDEGGLGITVTFLVAWEYVGMAWLIQIIIATESQLLWSSWHPQGPSRWNEMHYRILCASFWQRFVFPLCWSPPPVWVLILQSMGPYRASEPSLAWMSFCSTKQGGRALWRSEWITFSSVCLRSLFKTKPLYFVSFFNCSPSAFVNDSRMNKLRKLQCWGLRDTFMNRTNGNWSDFCYLCFCLI